MAFENWRGSVGIIKPTLRPGSMEDLIRLLPDGWVDTTDNRFRGLFLSKDRIYDRKTAAERQCKTGKQSFHKVQRMNSLIVKERVLALPDV